MYENDVYLRSTDAAAFLGVCKLTILRMIHRGEFESARLEDPYGHPGGRAYEIAKSELQAKKDQMLGKKTVVEKPVINEPKTSPVVDHDQEIQKAKIKIALLNLRSAMNLLSDCVGDLIEEMT